jgi:signal transduction histidine kinase
MPSLVDSFSPRRAFWLVLLLAVVPTIVLAVYGVIGVVDRQLANEQRLRERYLIQAGSIELGVVARLEEEDLRLKKLMSGVAHEEMSEKLHAFEKQDPLIGSAWVVGQDELPHWLGKRASTEAKALSERAPVAFLTIEHEEGSGFLTVVALSWIEADRLIAYVLEPEALDALVIPELTGRQFQGEPAEYHLMRARQTEPSGPISFTRLRQDLSAQLEQESALVDRPMAPPFNAWRITISSTKTPTGGTGRTIGVLALAGATLVGVWALGRALLQQADLSRLQTEFISNVSHELRTPLTSIRMFIETLQSGRVKDPVKVQECLDIIAAESERLSRKIERVLSWARMEAGRRIYEFEGVAPKEAIAEVLEAFRAQQLSGGNPVEVEAASSLPLMRIDRDAFGEAMLNLLSNARKYGGDQVQIRITAWAERRAVAVAVSDTGPGIPPSELDRIFEKFYRPKILLSERTQGSGLGLAIVRSVIEAHKGSVEVFSQNGQGARFVLRFPRY